MKPRWALLVSVSLIIVTLLGNAADAATITVRQDGTGDYLTIDPAVAASFDGDTIEIGPGTYSEPPLVVAHSLTLVSTDGAAATILDGQGAIRILRFEGAANTSTVEGLTFYNGNNAGVGSVVAVLNAHLNVTDCVFEANQFAALTAASGATMDVTGCLFDTNESTGATPGAVYLSGAGAFASISGCEFTSNSTMETGGAISVVGTAAAAIDDCTFSGNEAAVHGSAIHVGEGSTADITSCLFVDNIGGVSGPIYCFRAFGTVWNNTFYQNANLYETWGAVLIQETMSVTVYRNIFYGQTNGAGLYYLDSGPGGGHGCNVFWNNDSGTVVGAGFAPDDIVADPVFCDAPGGDFSVSHEGPAAPANSLCGLLIGAFDPACGVEPPPPPDLTRILVRQDGTGDYTNVFDAVDASTAGDTINIGPGTYSSPTIIVTHQLRFETTDGPAATALSGALGGSIIKFLAGASNCRVENLTFTQGYRTESNVAAVGMGLGATLEIEGCVFEENDCAAVGVGATTNVVLRGCTVRNNEELVSGTAGFYFSGTGATVLVEDCYFEGNHSVNAGGAMYIANGASATINKCEFVDNSALWGGAIHCGDASADVYGSLFVENVGIGAAIYYFRSAGQIARNTFYNNTATPEPFACVLIQDTQSVIMTRNIISNTTNGYGLALFALYEPTGVLESCNVYWQNDLGPVGGQPLDPSSEQADPVFCDAPNGDFTVSTLGAAAPANAPCGELVGAFETACEIEPPPPPPPPLGDAPHIVSIVDVPNDEGRHVRIQWVRSGQDEAGTEHTITGYAIYRYDGMLEGASPRPGIPAGATTREKGAAIEDWDYLLTVPARGDSIYQTVVETTCDITVHGPCSNAFFVSAMTEDPLVFFDSEPDTGSSLDNLPPGPPLALEIGFEAGGAQLSWKVPDAPDVVGYRVYRGAGPDFAVGVESRVGETVDPNWDDADGTPLHFYKVTGVDDAGNEGEPAAFSPATTSSGMPRVFWLGQNLPNPFNPTTTIPYVVGPGGGHVTLRVYDVMGRLVATLVDETQPAGPKAIQWTGRDHRGSPVASGTYFYRLTGPGFEKTRKMTLIQ